MLKHKFILVALVGFLSGLLGVFVGKSMQEEKAYAGQSQKTEARSERGPPSKTKGKGKSPGLIELDPGIGGNVVVGTGITPVGYMFHAEADAVSPNPVGYFKNTVTSSDGRGVKGECSSTDFYGIGVEGIGGYVGVRGEVLPTGASTYYGVYGYIGASGGTSHGVYGRGYSSGVYGYTPSTANNSYGVKGAWSSSNYGYLGSKNLDGYQDGCFATTDIASGGEAGVWGANTNASGTGVEGSGNNLSTYYLSEGSGGAFVGNRYGIYARQHSNSQLLLSYAAVYALGYANCTGNSGGTIYNAVGQFWNQATSNVDCIGVWGSAWPADIYGYGAWVQGGYYGIRAEGYTGNYYKSGIDELLSGGVLARGAVGVNSIGSKVGAAIVSDELGVLVMGKKGEPAGYFDGFVLSTGYNAMLIKNEGHLTPCYTMVSDNVNLQAVGQAFLSSGKAIVGFDREFSSLVSESMPIVVVLTPIGECGQLKLVSTTPDGFTVASTEGKSGWFNWMAVGRVKGYETKPDIPAKYRDTEYTDKLAANLYPKGKGFAPFRSQEFFATRPASRGDVKECSREHPGPLSPPQGYRVDEATGKFVPVDEQHEKKTGRVEETKGSVKVRTRTRE